MRSDLISDPPLKLDRSLAFLGFFVPDALGGSFWVFLFQTPRWGEGRRSPRRYRERERERKSSEREERRNEREREERRKNREKVRGERYLQEPYFNCVI